MSSSTQQVWKYFARTAEKVDGDVFYDCPTEEEECRNCDKLKNPSIINAIFNQDLDTLLAFINPESPYSETPFDAMDRASGQFAKCVVVFILNKINVYEHTLSPALLLALGTALAVNSPPASKFIHSKTKNMAYLTSFVLTTAITWAAQQYLIHPKEAPMTITHNLLTLGVSTAANYLAHNFSNITDLGKKGVAAFTSRLNV